MNQASMSKSRSKGSSRIVRPASIEAVNFTDGMLVTAEDLDSAMHYPLSVVQVLLRSYFGCGIVCGLGVSDPNRERADHRESAPAVNQAATGAPAPARDSDYLPRRGFVVEVGAGVALGCDNYPIELCGAVRLDLSPDPCACPIEAETLRFIAIRRDRAPVAPSRSCGCGPAAGDPGQQCSRVADHVVVEAFDRMPDGICMKSPTDYESGKGEGEDRGACACLQECPCCDRCAEPWVLLATVRIDADGLVPEGINRREDVEDHGGPAHVKPIACVCAAEAALAERFKSLDDRIKRLEQTRSAVATPSTPTPTHVATPPPPAPPPPSVDTKEPLTHSVVAPDRATDWVVGDVRNDLRVDPGVVGATFANRDILRRDLAAADLVKQPQIDEVLEMPESLQSAERVVAPEQPAVEEVAKAPKPTARKPSASKRATTPKA